jgi:hypothetical protein
MCYSNFCALVRKNIPDEGKTANAKAVPATPPAISEKPPVKPANQKMSDAELASLPEDERLEMLKNETFAKVRAPKPHGPLIVKPKTREQELQELFGPKVKSDTPPS